MISSHVGDVRAVLASMPARSVHMVATSPPYYGLRDYGLEGVEWADGWRGCLGLEPTPEMYVEHLCEVFDEVARVLRSDGTLWLNLGDSYARDSRVRWDNSLHREAGWKAGQEQRNAPNLVRDGAGYKPKDLVGIPWLVAFALRKRGWYLRAWAPWVKRNVLPSSVTDRPGSACEDVFLFGHPESGGRYYYDGYAVKQGAVRGAAGSRFDQGKTARRRVAEGPRASDTAEAGRNFRNSDPFFTSLRDVLDGGEAMLLDDDGDPLAFVVNPKPFKEAHFAVWPKELVRPMILAGTSEKGVCASCGAPWRRVTGRPCKSCGEFVRTQGKFCESCGYIHDWKADRGISIALGTTDWSTPGRGTPRKLGASGHQGAVPAQVHLDAGWTPSCACPPADPVPATVLDPFGGSGTTALVAAELCRRAVYVDANPEYAEIARRRWASVETQSPVPRAVTEAPSASPPAQQSLLDFLARLKAAP